MFGWYLSSEPNELLSYWDTRVLVKLDQAECVGAIWLLVSFRDGAIDDVVQTRGYLAPKFPPHTAPMFGWYLSSEPNELLSYWDTRVLSKVRATWLPSSLAEIWAELRRGEPGSEVFVTFRVKELPEQNVESRLETRCCHHPLILSSQGSEIFPRWGAVPTRDSDAQVSMCRKRSSMEADDEALQRNVIDFCAIP
ncbi:hypothetical protein PIB30_035387 [Stylosanthes scabra]|uniref:Uncharacterized protein n=1 Tax=Stylosanthes scabra TaxID=79078 RepID=A0ABU6YBH1_9FABA|nr:hypothetical protein [Stylosanthes scabra]